MGVSSKGAGPLSSRLTSAEVDDTGIMSEINITPLTDIFLVLLVIFMVTSSVMSQMGINVQLPKSNQAASAAESQGVIVSVTSSGDIFVNNTKVTDVTLREAISSVLSRSANKTVILEGDKEAVLGTVVRVMDEAKKAGALKFAVATQSSGGKN